MLLASRSKSRQKVVKKLSKSLKSHWFGGTFTKAPILRRRTQASVRALTVIRALFAGPESSLKAAFASIIDKAKLMELLMLCHVFSLKEPVFFKLLCTELLSVQRMSSLHYSSSEMRSKYSALRRLENSLCTPFFPYFNSGDAFRMKTSQPRIDRLGEC